MSSNRTIPLIFLNLGGEMMYVLDQRLNAQNIPKDKGEKVMNEIVSIMLNERFLMELFKPQEVYNKAALKKLFQDLAHASIMRLNAASMDKLYDLMTMAFKYQVFMAQQPVELLFITLNHLDAFRACVTSPSIHKQIENTYMLIMNTYAHLSIGEWQTIRYSILNFLQDLRVRVSVFLRQGEQNNDGYFVIQTSGPVPPGCEIPGFIRLFNSNGELQKVTHFHAGGDYQAARQAGSVELVGNRGTELGSNIYKSSDSEDISPVQTRSNLNLGPCQPSLKNTSPSFEAIHQGMVVGREELNLLLAQLLGTDNNHTRPTVAGDVIRLNLFSSQEEEDGFVQQQDEIPCLSIDARTHPRSIALDKIFGEMTLDNFVLPDSGEEQEDDLLRLLDSC